MLMIDLEGTIMKTLLRLMFKEKTEADLRYTIADPLMNIICDAWKLKVLYHKRCSYIIYV